MKYAIPLLFFFLGVVVFYNYAEWGYPVCVNGSPAYIETEWDLGYFFWDKTKDALLIGTIVVLLSKVAKESHRVRQILIISKSVLIFALIRLLWEVISLVTGISINQKVVIDIIFIIFLLVWVYPALKILWQWRKQKY